MRSEKGFTLVEIMIVVAIIAIGAFIAGSNIIDWITHNHSGGFQRMIAQTMEEARNRAVSSQRQHRVIIDATGLSLNQYGRWITVRTGRKKVKKKFIKLHLALDKRSGKILVGICSKGWKHDHKFGVQIVKSLRRSFARQGTSVDIELLDSGYLSREMTSEIEKSKAVPYVKMKKNSITRSGRKPSWKRNIRFQKDNPDEFMKEYCYRVVIEGVISALKKLFGSTVSSKKRPHQNVEVLCRLILWNCMH